MKFSPTKNQNESRKIAIYFPDKLAESVEKIIQLGRDGIDMNMDKKGAPQALIYRQHEMAEDVFDLGCKIHENKSELNHKAWAFWMMDAEIDRDTSGVIIKHRSVFFCQYADRALGNLLREYYGVPVCFKADRSIAAKVG